MKSLIVLLLCTTTSNAAEFEKLLTVGSFYETNSFYEYGGSKGDFFAVVKPELIYNGQNRKGFNFTGYGAFEYDQYIVHSNQTFYQYDTFVEGKKFFSDSFNLYLRPYIKTNSEPAFSATTSRLVRQYLGGSGGFEWRWSELVKVSTELNFTQETQSQSEYAYQANQEMSAEFKHIYSFLPETGLVTRLLVGQKTYPNGTVNLNSNATLVKYSSQYFEAGTGVVGRLTRNMKMTSYAGFLYRPYQAASSFSEPVFNIEFEEERNPRDMVLLGYSYKVDDSYANSNFVLKQKMYIGFGRIFGDQLLALAQLSYNYLSYSKPNRREDQRLAGEFKLDYSFSSTLKAEGILRFDLLTSDAMAGVDPNTNALPADPQVDYSYVRLGFFLKYLL